MADKFRAFFLSLTIVALMTFSVYGTTTVYADDGTTTEETETSTHETDTEESVPSDSVDETAHPEDHVVGTEEPLHPDDHVADTDETAHPEDHVVGTEEPLHPDDHVADTDETSQPHDVVSPEPTLEQLPDNTTVTVVNSDGEVQPLASQESADAITTATDPMWCPAGQTPGGVGCTEAFSSFSELLTFLLTNQGNAAYQQSGTIYIEQGAYAGGEDSIDFNNYAFTDFKNYDLTLQGGWDSSDNSTDSTSQFNAPIIIGSSLNPWVGSLTFNGLVISNVTNQTGLTAYTEGNITVSNVEVTDSQAGAELSAGGNVLVEDSKFNDNSNAGAVVNAGGKVDINDSEFNGNGDIEDIESSGFGLEIESGSNVSLNQVIASNNEKFGANITADGKVTIGNSVFSGNKGMTCANVWCYHPTYDGYGLQVLTTGNIALNIVTASENNLFGALLKGDVVSIANGTFSNNGSGSGQSLTGSGLEIVSASSVALSNVAANGNQLFGANIQAVGDVSIASGFFNCNKVTTYHPCLGVGTGAVAGGYGLKIVTKGSIALADVETIDNYLYGASLTGFNVTIANGVFSYNGSGSENNAIGYGLKVVSAGKVTIDNIAANYNQLYGADILAKDSVSISTGFFNGQQAYILGPGGVITYYGYGLQVFTADDITLDGVQANFNNLWGANLDATQDVLILDSQFNNNVTKSVVFIDDTGLLVNSLGNVTLINVEAKENRLIGATITAVGTVNISGSNFSGNKGTICANVWCYHPTYYGYGLKVVTPSSIFLGNVIADNNNLFGANLTGSSVTIFDSTFNNNGSGDNKNPTGKGLEVVSTGDVTLMNVNASYNELFGANIQSGGNVTINSSIFNGTTGQGYGLKVVTPGNINLTPGSNGIGVTANDNGAEGAILDGENVVVVNSSFTGNGATGLTITATIATLSGVTASTNGVDGAKVCADVVSVFGSKFENNSRYGLNVGSPQLVEVGNTYTGNGTAGLFVNPTCVIDDGVVDDDGNGDSNDPVHNELPDSSDPIHVKLPDVHANSHNYDEPLFGHSYHNYSNDPIRVELSVEVHENSSNEHQLDNSYHNDNSDSIHNEFSDVYENAYHGHKFGNSYHGGSSHKSCHSISNKHGRK